MPDRDADERIDAYWRELANSADRDRTEVVVQSTPRGRPAASRDPDERIDAYWRELANSADQDGTEVVVLKGTQRQRQAAEQDALAEGNRVSLAM